MAKLIPLILLVFLCPAAAQAQELFVEEILPQGLRPAFLGSADARQALLGFQIELEKFDLNGDGSPEVVVIREDAEGNPTELAVLDVSPFAKTSAGFTELWTVDLTQLRGNSSLGPLLFMGFFDVFFEIDLESTLRAAVFSGEGVQVFHPDFGSDVVFSLDSSYELLGVVDVDGDGLHELIVDNTTEGVYEVWGAGEAGRSRR